MFPTIAEYNQVIRTHGVDAFKTLQGLSFVPSRTLPVKIYSYGSGAYAVVFKAKAQFKEYAIRCFISADNETLNRYRSICNYLKGINESWCTEIEILEDEIDVHGRYYPVVKMEWVNGQLINKFITDNLHNNSILSKLQEEIVKVSESLESHTIGHGDIQCGNILVTKDAAGNPIIKLIDYDGLYIPEFANKQNLEHGRSEFQHPQRSQSYFNERIDRFSFWVMLTALEALKHDKSLWLEVMQGGFNTLDNLLFTGEDFKNFRKSKLVQRLYGFNKPALTYYLNSLEFFCKSPIPSVDKPVIFSLNTVTPATQNHSTSIVTNTNVTSDQNLSIEVISSPAGASVLTTTLKWIGQTPLKLEKSKYVGKTLVISYGLQVKQSVVSDSTRLIDVSFKEEEPIKVQQPSGPNLRIKDLKKPKFTPVAHPPKPLTVNNTAADPQPVYQSYNNKTTNKRKPKKSKNNYTYLILLLIGFIIVLLAVAYNNKQQAYKADHEEVAAEFELEEIESEKLETTVSEVSEVVSTVPVNTTNNQAASTGRLVSTKDQYNQTANEVVWQFFEALKTRDCNRAWNLTYIEYWENEGQSSFCNLDNYGGVTNANIEKFESIIGAESEMLFKIVYTLSFNGRGLMYYNQYIKLEKRKTSEGKLQWYIIEMEDVAKPYKPNS